MFLVFDWWLDVIWLKSHRNATNCIDFNIVIRILNTPVSAKMAQGQRKWHVVIYIYIYIYITHIVLQSYFGSLPQCALPKPNISSWQGCHGNSWAHSEPCRPWLPVTVHSSHFTPQRVCFYRYVASEYAHPTRSSSYVTKQHAWGSCLIANGVRCSECHLLQNSRYYNTGLM